MSSLLFLSQAEPVLKPDVVNCRWAAVTQLFTLQAHRFLYQHSETWLLNMLEPH